MNWQIILKSTTNDEEGRNDRRYGWKGSSYRPLYAPSGKEEDMPRKTPKANKMYMFLKRLFAKERTAQFDKMYVRLYELDKKDLHVFLQLVEEVERLFAGNGIIFEDADAISRGIMFPDTKKRIEIDHYIYFSDKQFADAKKINMINESGIDSIWVQMKRLIRRKK